MIARAKVKRPNWPAGVETPEGMDSEQIHVILRAVANQLKSKERSAESSRFVGACLLGYLNNEYNTLDAAFGLSRRGAPRQHEKRDIAIAVSVLKFRLRRKPKARGDTKRFLLDLCTRYNLRSPRNIELIAKTYRLHATRVLMSKLAPKIHRRFKRQAEAARKTTLVIGRS